MPATFQEIKRIWDLPEFSLSDKLVVEWQFQLCGDFHKALWNCIKQADEENLRRLEKGFPLHVQGYKDWAYGDLGERLRKAGLNI